MKAFVTSMEASMKVPRASMEAVEASVEVV